MPVERLLLSMFALLPILSAQASSGNDIEVERHLASARASEKRQDYVHAGGEYQKLLLLRPNNASFHQSLALTFHLRNRFSLAIAEFSRAVQLDSSLWGSRLFLGMDYYKTNHFEKAIANLEESIKLNPAQAEPEARFWLGASSAALGRYQDAIREYRRAAELRPKDIEVLYQLALAYDHRASALFEQIGQLEPGAAAVFLLQAERFLAENRATLAEQEYRRAITLRPDLQTAIPALEKLSQLNDSDLTITEPDARAVFGLAQYWRSRGNGSKADESLARLAKLKPANDRAREYVAAAQKTAAQLDLPDDTQAWAQLQEVSEHIQAARYPVAETLLEKLLKQNDRNLDALLALGRIYKLWADSVLESMVSINPDSSRVYQLQGEQEEAKGENQRALQAYQTALQRQPDQLGVAYAIGNIHWKLHNYDQAEPWLRKELDRNPHHGLAQFRLGDLYLEQGKAEEAIPQLQEAITSHPEWIDARFDLGRALALKGRSLEAIAELKKVAAADPDNDRVHYLLANTFRKLNREAEAKAEMALYQDLTRKRLDRAQKAVRDVSNSLEKGALNP